MEQKEFLEQFLASVSHEFKTPLASLTASLEIFWDEADHLSRQDIRELLKSLRLSVTHLGLLVDNLLENTSIQADQMTLKTQIIPIPALLAPTLATLQPLLDRRSQTLSYSCPFYLPPVRADVARIRQVLLNLVTNASKFSPESATIELEIEQDAAWIRVHVLDRGRGIPEGQHEAIFQPFTRFEEAFSDESGGLGLGLAVVKAIITAHGGQVGASSRIGGGTKVWFTLSGVTDENSGG